MTEKVNIIYTIAKCDPRNVVDSDMKVSDVKQYFRIINRLKPDSVFKFKNILLGMARRLSDVGASSSSNKVNVKNLFVDGYKSIHDEDSFYIVERVMVGDDVLAEPLGAWTVDVRVFKAILTRNLYLSMMDEKDILRLELAYKLHQYPSRIIIGEVDGSDIMEYVRRYNSYLCEFYRRSQNPNRRVCLEYLKKAKYANELVTYNRNNVTNKFELEVSAVGTLEQVKQNIKDFAKDMTFYTERMYQSTYGEDALKSTTGKGKSHYKEKFKKYDKCLDVYDRYKDKVPANKSIDDESFNPTIDIAESTRKLSEQKQRDRRKDIRKHYKMALGLIQQSTEGYLS